MAGRQSALGRPRAPVLRVFPGATRHDHHLDRKQNHRESLRPGELDILTQVQAIPKITDQFHSLPDIGWYSAGYSFAAAIIQPLAGKCYVNFVNKWTFLIFFGIFELGSLICGVAPSSSAFIAGRVIAGLGVAGLQNGAFTIIAASAPLHQRPLYVGVGQSVAMVGTVVGPLIGGALTQYTTWRWCFYINLPPGAIIALVLAWTRVPDATTKPALRHVFTNLQQQLDLVGTALLAPSMVMLLLALQWGGNEYAWSSPTIIGLFCGFAGQLLVWLGWDWYRKDAALIPFSLMKQTTVWSACLQSGLQLSSLFILAYYLPVYFQVVRGDSPTLSGVYMLPNILAALLSAIIVGRAVQWVGYYTPFSIASVVFGAVGTGLLSTLGPHTSVGAWIGYQILFGIGRGMGTQMPVIAIQARTPPRQAMLGVALCVLSGMLLGSILLSASATILTNSVREVLVAQAPQVDVAAVLAAGATGFRSVVPADQIADVVAAYSTGIDRIFYLATAAVAACFPFCFGLGWTNIKKKESAKSAGNEERGESAKSTEGEVTVIHGTNKAGSSIDEAVEKETAESVKHA